jgi:hypothetical protein
MGKVGSDTSRARLAGEFLNLLVRVARAIPALRRAQKDLDALGAEIDGALDRRRESAAG